jgi:hypothetical protein
VHTAPARPPGQPASTIYLHVRSVSSWPAGRHWTPNESPTPKQPSLRLQVPGGVEGTEHPNESPTTRRHGWRDGRPLSSSREMQRKEVRGRRRHRGASNRCWISSDGAWKHMQDAAASQSARRLLLPCCWLLAAGLAGAWPPGPEPTCVVLDLRCWLLRRPATF